MKKIESEKIESEKVASEKIVSSKIFWKKIRAWRVVLLLLLVFCPVATVQVDADEVNLSKLEKLSGGTLGAYAVNLETGKFISFSPSQCHQTDTCNSRSQSS